MRTLGLALVLAGCAQLPTAPATAKVCVPEKAQVGSRVWITELSRNGSVTEVLGPSRECADSALPILAIAKGD